MDYRSPIRIGIAEQTVGSWPPPAVTGDGSIPAKGQRTVKNREKHRGRCDEVREMEEFGRYLSIDLMCLDFELGLPASFCLYLSRVWPSVGSGLPSISLSLSLSDRRAETAKPRDSQEPHT